MIVHTHTELLKYFIILEFIITRKPLSLQKSLLLYRGTDDPKLSAV